MFSYQNIYGNQQAVIILFLDYLTEMQFSIQN